MKRRSGKLVVSSAPPFVKLWTYLRTEYNGVVECVARCDQLVNNLKPTFIPNFFVQAANDGLVIQEHWGFSSSGHD